MADKKVTKDSISDKDPFGNIRKSAEETTPEIVALSKALEAIQTAAKATKKGAKIVDPKDVKSIDELNKLTERSNNLSKAKIQIDEALIKEKLKLQEANKNRNKDLKAAIVLEDKEAGTLQKLAAANTKLRQERDKLNLETKKGQQRLKEINAQLDKNNKVIEKNSDKLKQQKIGIGRYGKALGGLRSSLLKLGAAFGVGFGVQQLRSFATASVEAFREQQKAIAQVEAGLKSTGNQVGITSQKLQQMASDLQKKTLFGDEEILKDATAQLLTFTNIAGDNFGRTQEAVLDLATRLDGDLKSASIQLGKALNDPVANLSALSRSGIQFSQSQKDVIKALTESGRLAEAQTIILDELNKQYGGSAEAAAEADGGLTQLSNTIGDAKEKFGEIILEGLKPTIKSLKEFFENLSKEDIENFLASLGKLFKVLTQIGAIFLVYKARLIAINVAQKLFNDESGEMNVSLKQIFKNLKSGEGGLKKFGGALKGIGWAAAITLAVQMAVGLYEIATGARAVKDALEDLGKLSGSFSAELDKSISKIKDQLQATKDQINEDVAKGIIDETEAIKRRTEAIEVANKAIESQIAMRRFNKNINIQTKKALEDLAKTEGLSSQQKAELAVASEEINRLGKEIIELKGIQNNLSREEINLNLNQIGINNDLLKQTKDELMTQKELVDLYLLLANSLAGLNEEQRTAAELLADRVKFGSIEADQLEDFALATERRALAELHYLITLKEIAILEAQRNGDTEETIRLEAELLELKKQHINLNAFIESQGKSAAEQQQAAADAKKEVLELEVETTEDIAKEKFEIDKQYIDLAEAYFIASADRKIKKLDEEIAAHQRQADLLEQLAVNGNITAQESLAAENQAIAEANAQKEQEEKRKQQILAVSAFLQAYTSNLASGDDSATAFTKAATSQAVVDQFIGSLVGFHDGTEDTGNAGVFSDEHGVITGYTHKNERVITAADNAKMAGYSNAEVTRIVENHRLGDYTGGLQLGGNWEQQQLVSQLMDVKQGLAEVNETIKNRPVSNLEVGNVLASYMTFSQKITKGNDSVTYKHKIK